MTLNTTKIQKLAKSDATEAYNDAGHEAAVASLKTEHGEASDGLVNALGGSATCKFLGCTEETLSDALSIYDVAYRAATEALVAK